MANPYKPITASHPRSMEPMFDQIKQLRPDLKSGSRISQEAVKHYLAYLRSGNDPLVGVMPQPIPVRSATPKAKVQLVTLSSRRSEMRFPVKATERAKKDDNALSRLWSRNPHRKGVELARIGSGGAPVRTFRKDGYRIDVYLKPPIQEEGAGVIPEW